jgi:hypothetical protein
VTARSARTSPVDREGSTRGRRMEWAIISGSGGLANLHGSLQAVGAVAAVDTNSGKIQFGGPQAALRPRERRK